MTFYGRLIKIIHSYFNLRWRKGNKSQMWNTLITFTDCLITFVSIISSAVNRRYFGRKEEKKKKKADEHSCGKKTVFSHWWHKYPFCVPPEVKWTVTSLLQTIKSSLRITSVTCWILCSVEKKKAWVWLSALAPHSHGTLLQPIYKADHKLLEVMTGFYFSGYLKFTAGGKKLFSCLTLFYCVLHKMPKLNTLPLTNG